MNQHDKARTESRLRGMSVVNTPAIIIGNGSANDLSFIRSLVRRSIPVVHLVADRQLGSFSRYGLRIRMPTVEDEPHSWLEILETARAVLGTVPVLFALSDAHCAFVSLNAERLRRSCRFVLPDKETLRQILDKRQQYAAAKVAGIRVPPTFYPESVQDIVRLASEIDYPVILKPYTAHIGRPKISNRKVLVVQSAQELISTYTDCMASGARFMVQKIVAEKDDAIFWYSGFWDEQGRERAWFTVQKLRQFPPRFGDGSFQQTVDVPGVLQQSRRLLEFFQYRGLVMVEFKCDPTDASYNLIEINPRTVSGNQLGISAGVDLPWIAYRNLADLEPAETLLRAFSLSVKYVNEEWDVQSFAALRKSQELTFADWIWSWRGIRAWALFAWDDPLPLLVGLWRFLRICMRRALGGSDPSRNRGNA